MAVLSRVNWVSAQRVDVPDMQAIDSYISSDFRAMVKMMCGTTASYILTGMVVTGASGRDVTIAIADSGFWLPIDESGCLYFVGPDEEPVVLTLPANSTVYVEAVFTRTTGTTITRATFDETAVSDASPEGSEYTASVDAQNYMVMTISQNTVGFTSGAVPIARFVTTSTVSNYTDCRSLFFRLGTGGSTPNSTYQYPWSVNRAAAPTTGTVFGTDTAGSPFQKSDSGGIMNDSAFTSFKDFHDALLTIIAEIRGVSIWYTSSAIAAYIAGISLNQLQFDSPGGHHMVPDASTYITWSRDSDNKLRSEGTGPIQWKANYGYTRWELGGSFNATTRVYTGTGDPLFEKTIADGSNVYLAMLRDAVIGAGEPVEWRPSVFSSGFVAERCVKGSTGAFTGVAIGDFIRKDSEGISKYYEIVKIYDGGGVNTTDGYLADSSAVELEVDRDISLASAEPYRYFRRRYDDSAIVVDDAASLEAGTYNDVNYFWLARREGAMLYLREYGSFYTGESRIVGDDSEAPLNSQLNNISVQFISSVRYEGDILHYVDATGAFVEVPSIALLSIYKRPNARQSALTATTFTVNSAGAGALELDTDGKSIWVKLSSEDGTSYVLSNGDVTDPTATNVYTILSAAAAPLNIYDNKDVHLLCTRRTFGGVAYLEFFDGQILGPNGLVSKSALEVLSATTLNASLTTHVDSVSATPYTIDYIEDHHVSVTVSGVHSVVLPAVATADLREGTIYYVSDVAGTCIDSTSCINVTAADAALIDGSATYVIDSPYATIGFQLVGSAWKVI